MSHPIRQNRMIRSKNNPTNISSSSSISNGNHSSYFNAEEGIAQQQQQPKKSSMHSTSMNEMSQKPLNAIQYDYNQHQQQQQHHLKESQSSQSSSLSSPDSKKYTAMRQTFDRFTKFRPNKPIQQRRGGGLAMTPLEISSGDGLLLHDKDKLRSQKYSSLWGLGSVTESAMMRNLIPHRQTRVLLTWFMAIFLIFPMLLFWVVLFETITKHHRGSHGQPISTRMRHKIAKADAKGGYNSFPINLPKLELSPDETEMNGQVFVPIESEEPESKVTSTESPHLEQDENQTMDISPSERLLTSI